MQSNDCSIRIQSTNHRCWLRRVETERNKMKTKDDRKDSQNKQIAQTSPFFLNFFPGFFQKALVGNKLFFYFFTIFIYFSLNKDHKRCNHKNWHLQLRWDVAYRNSARSLKSVQKLWQIFFLYFPDFFWQFWWNQTRRSQVWVGSKWCQEVAEKISDFLDKRVKSYACFTKGISRYVFWEAQHGGGS